ncbi:Spo0E family sporulation regulatory protein-aspartic acid phosphatase [Irregularibacter muris]|uniref:Spo0E family sporulation regulatory protein-aspartic acid phosphatase n=1 Tax=Irregularibacter muris TaxID=1796619 RepID=A0AAE3HHP6_9FIRM|nr:Spo0E family sporulation regulatory protein-aspartic acid phosphatase [Irregularibacter muris]MCR1899323.1 Spo0E family sporulation regulatory protein-aspartic acid phosphatase [Irregularibacter muris]
MNNAKAITLKHQLDTIRCKLENILCEGEISSEEVCNMSRTLDQFIVIYQRLMLEKK